MTFHKAVSEKLQETFCPNSVEKIKTWDKYVKLVKNIEKSLAKIKGRWYNSVKDV